MRLFNQMNEHKIAFLNIQDFYIKKYNFNQDIENEKLYNSKDSKVESKLLFENQPELLRPHSVAKLLDISVNTIYDWKYRGKTRNIPSDLFLSLNRSLYIKTEVLRRWLLTNTQEFV